MNYVDVRFISANQFKQQEAASILSRVKVNVIPLSIRVDELQTEDTNRLVKDKTLKAFYQVGRPLFVEHTGLYLEYLNGLPGGLTQIFWDRLQADRVSELFGKSSNPVVVAKTVIGYTDGRAFHTFDGEVSGIISETPRGPRDFQWDCVFIPAGYSETFAEMGDKKNDISMRRLALDKFAQFLNPRGQI